MTRALDIDSRFAPRVRRAEPMSRHTSWHVGGPADVFFTPSDRSDLLAFLETLPVGTPLFWLGLGSNLLVRDGGIRGVVIDTTGLDRLESIDEQLSKYWPWGERNRISTDPNNPMEDRLISCFEMYPVPGNGWVEWYVMEDGQKRRLYNVLIDREREYRVMTSLENLVRHQTG